MKPVHPAKQPLPTSIETLKKQVRVSISLTCFFSTYRQMIYQDFKIVAMKHPSLHTRAPFPSFLLVLLLAAPLSALAGNGPGAIIMPKTYQGESGPDNSVPPELGGPGFEEIALELGWQDGAVSNEMLRYINPLNARKGGEIKGPIDHFPATFRSYGKDGGTTGSELLNSFVYQSLIDINPVTSEFMPVLASHWKVDEDRQTYYFRINPYARFSDGYPVTVDDVIATYELLTDEGILDPFRNQFYGEGYDPPRKISKYIFSIRSREKNWKNMFYFGTTLILPAHYIGDIDGATYLENFHYKMPPGSDPYVLLDKNVNKGHSVTLTRLADWWDKDSPYYSGRYNFDKIKLIAVNDDNLAYAKFISGEFDCFFVNRAEWWKTKFDFEEVKQGLVQKRKIYNDNPQGIQGFAFNTRREPFNDPHVRRAFTLLFNRAAMIDEIMYNEYEISDSYFPNSDYENPNNPEYRYNPKEAIKLLKEAGYTQRNTEGILMKGETPLRIELPVIISSMRIMEPIQQTLKQAGVQMDLRVVDYAQQMKLASTRNFDLLYMAYSGLVYPNPTGMFHSNTADADYTNNMSGFKNLRADEIIEEELVTFDQKRRIALIRELDSILMEAQPFALAWYAPFQRIAYWNYFGQPDFYISRMGDWQNVYTYWWYDEKKATTVKNGKDTPSVTMEVGDVDVFFWPEFK